MRAPTRRRQARNNRRGKAGQTQQQNTKRGRMSKIHPTAIIEPGAQLDESVEVGPYAIIGPRVEMAARPTLGWHSVSEGPRVLGRDNRIGHYASVGGRPQDMKYKDEPTRLAGWDRNTKPQITTIHTRNGQV